MSSNDFSVSVWHRRTMTGSSLKRNLSNSCWFNMSDICARLTVLRPLLISNIWSLLPYEARRYGTKVDLPRDFISGFNDQPSLYANVFSQYVLVNPQTEKHMEECQSWGEFVQRLRRDFHMQAKNVARDHSQRWDLSAMER